MEPKIGICDYCSGEEYNRIINSIPSFRKMSDTFETREEYADWKLEQITKLTEHLNQPVMSIDLDYTSIDICSSCLREYANRLDVIK